MGNILSLQCNRLLDNGQWGLGDDIAYSYIGNQLYKADNQASQPSYVSHYFFSDNVDLETEYAYDENGNMVKNLNKNVDSITYNEIGMPRCISFKGGGKTEYIYSATGEKLQVKHTPSIGDKAIITNYCGEAVFDDINLETVFFDGGYMSYKHTSSPLFYHYVKDYQGSNRVIYNAKNDEAIQWISYYPFGSILNSDQDVDFQRYFYNGKELESLQGLFLYDYGARFYDGIRFTTMDPLAEKYYSISPYAYCLNNPIRFIDYNGEAPGDYFKTPDDAAYDFGLYYNDNSIREDREYASSIYMVKDENNDIRYTYTIANVGKTHTSTESKPPVGAITVATVHSHGAYSPGYYGNEFSGIYFKRTRKHYADLRNSPHGDIGIANRNKKNIYLATPNGSLKKYEFQSGKITILSRELPSDYKDPTRQNNNSSWIRNSIQTPLEIIELYRKQLLIMK